MSLSSGGFADFKDFGEAQLSDLRTFACFFALAIQAAEQPHWLSMLGATGNGKTHLAKLLYRVAKSRTPPASIVPGRVKYPWETLIDGARCQFIDWRTFCGKLLDKQWHLLDEVCDAWFVVLDDIGTEHDPSGVLKNALDRILNSRIGMWTVITSNLFYDQIAEKLDVRIASRMRRCGSVVVETNATDFVLRG